MAVLAGWESALSERTRLPVGRDRLARWPRSRAVRRPARRPAGLASASPARPPVSSCTPRYRRPRLVGLLLLATVTAVVAAGLLVLRGVAADDGVPQRTAVVDVRSGETLWDLAERVAPRSSPPAVVERIRELNGMQGSTVHPGQPLLVPDGR
ncbi:MAG TPA: LysM peptidoglycan-binding domain-containing protein [Pseudonocardiaceae bacterium]